MKKVFLKLFLFVCFLGISTAIFAEFRMTNDYFFKSYSVSDGLSHSSVYTLHQDSKGFIWIGTKYGLNRFDGYEFVHFYFDRNNQYSLSYNEITCIESYGDEILWIGTRGGGLNMLDISNNDILHLKDQTKNLIIKDILIDKNNVLWVGTVDGLIKYDLQNSSDPTIIGNMTESAVFIDPDGIVFQPEKKDVDIHKIIDIGENKLLVGVTLGLYIYDKKNNTFKSVSEQLSKVVVFTGFVLDDEGNIWASSYDGLFKISFWDDPEKIKVLAFNSRSLGRRHLTVDWVTDVVVDKNNTIWASTRGDGIFSIVGDSVANHYNNILEVENSLQDNLVNTLMIDDSGALWLGAESQGVSIIDLNSKKFSRIYPSIEKEKGLSGNMVTSIDGYDNKIYSGNASRGMDILEFDRQNPQKINSISNITIEEIERNREIRSLIIDKHGDVWLGGAKAQLIKYSLEKNIKKSHIVNGFVSSFFEDDSRIWFGTWGSLGYINIYTEEIVEYYGNSINRLGLSSDKILTVFKASNNLLWIGTKGGGVNIINTDDLLSQTGTFYSYKYIEGNPKSLSYNDVNAICEDQNGNIWVGTGNGLNKAVYPDSMSISEAVMSNCLTFELYNEVNGLIGDYVSLLVLDNDGNLWVGTNNGISKIDKNGKEIINFDKHDGLPPNGFHTNASYLNPETGVLYFGGPNGIVFFHPDSIKINTFSYKPQITGLLVNNKEVNPSDKINNDQILKRRIEYTEKIDLSFKNNEVAFEFSSMNYTIPDKIKYAYRLKGFDETWKEAVKGNRRAIYTNLREGDYVFELKAANNSGTWSSETATITINIKPPIYRTIAAYSFYLLVILFLLLLFRRYSIIKVQKKNKLIIENIEYKKEREIEEAKLRFFTNISHEIRTPLTLIYGPLKQLLESKSLSSDTKSSLITISRNVKRLLNMVNQLLEFRRLDTGNIEVKKIKSNVLILIHDVIKSFEVTIENKRIETLVNVNENEEVIADERMMSTIIYNLLSNAYKFAPLEGNVRIEVSERVDKHKIIKICNSGPGIPEEKIPYIFNRFNKGNFNKEGETDGIGIGLSIVKEYVELHGGNISVTNIDEGGCCFEVIIPHNIEEIKKEEIKNVDYRSTGSLLQVEDNEEQFDEGGTFIKALNKNSDKSLKKTLMFIVEDDFDLRSWLEMVFKDEFNVIAFDNGKVAQKEIKNKMPDIIISDIMMPGISGTDLTSIIKNEIETSHIPVILLTAKTSDNDIIEGLKTGADSYLTKPFNADVLKAQVNSLLKARRSFREKFSGKLSIDPVDVKITPMDDEFLKNLIKITEERMSDPNFDVGVLIHEMNMSHSVLLKKVKFLTDMSIVEFIRSMRIKRAAQIFKQDNLSVSDVAYMVGFSDPKYFSKCFAQFIGEKPKAFVKRYHF